MVIFGIEMINQGELMMKLLDKLLCFLYAALLAYALYSIIFVPQGALLWSILLWLATPVIFSLVTIVFSFNFMLKKMIPTFQQANKIVFLATLKTIGLDMLYAMIFWIGADLVTIQTSTVDPVVLKGIAHTPVIIIAELLISMILFALVVSKVQFYAMRQYFVGIDRRLIKRLFCYASIIHVLILTLMCILWQVLIAYNVFKYV